MKTILLLLTEAFPFTKNTEAFLEPEIEIAIQYFDEVYIFPSSRGNMSKDKREIFMKNVYISPVKRECLLVECIKSMPYIFKHRGFWQDLKMLAKNGLLNEISVWRKLIYTIISEAAIIRHFKKLSFSIDKNAYIVIYSYWLFGEAGGAIGIKNIIKNKKIAIARGHGTDIFGYQSLKCYSPLKKYYMDELDGIYPISQKGKSILIEQYNKYNSNSCSISEKIHPIHLGIEDIGETDKYPKLSTSLVTIVSCSSLTPVKRVHLIVEGLSHIKTKRIKWIHLGSGDLLKDIKKKCDKMFGDNISYELKGALTREDVIDFYKKNDVHLFINVSSSEGIPVSIMEAFSFGIPVIATNVGGTSEICHDGINGFLIRKDFESTELYDLIDKTINLIENENEKYLLLRRNARETMIKEFSIANHKLFYEKILKKVHGDCDDSYFKEAKI